MPINNALLLNLLATSTGTSLELKSQLISKERVVFLLLVVRQKTEIKRTVTVVVIDKVKQRL